VSQYPDDNGQDFMAGQPSAGNVSVIVAGEVQEVHPIDPATVVVFITTAAAGGIIGNAAYDLLKIPYMLLRHGAKAEGSALDDNERWLLAKLAVQARCGELNWPVPELESFEGLTFDADANWLRFRLRTPSLECEVSIPHGRLSGSRLPVRLRRFTS
jgi:hypothetical protein